MYPLLMVYARAAFDMELAKRMIKYSDSAYCGDQKHGSLKPIQEWSCAPCSGLRFEVHGVMQDDESQTLAFSGVETMGDGNTSHQQIVVSFRGSVLSANYIDDYDEHLVEWWTPGKIHRGMHRSYSSLSSQLFKQMSELLEKLPHVQVIVTGHSLGAGQAVFAAVDLAANFTDTNFTVISFGTPRPGDAKFAAFASKGLPNLVAWPVAHRADTVPQCGIYSAPCNWKEKGFHQLSTSVWFPEDLVHPKLGPLDYKVCDGSGEDPKCQDEVPPKELNWADHDFYLNHSMWCCPDGVSNPAGCSFPFSGRR